MRLRVIISLGLCLLSALAAFAQPDPNHPQPDPREPKKPADQMQQMQQWLNRLANLNNQQQTVIAQNAHGVFILRSGVLVKLHPATLQQEALVDLVALDELNLPAGNPFGGKDAPAANDAPKDAQPDWRAMIQQGRRMLPAAMVLRERDLMIVSGDNYYRIDADTGKVAVNVRLVKEDPRLAEAQRQAQALERLRTAMTPITLEANEKILYVVRGLQVMAVDIVKGDLLAATTLPEKMRPALEVPKDRPGGERPVDRPGDRPVKGNRPDGGMEVTIVGTIVHHTENGLNLWTIRDARNEYLLAGERARDAQALAGKRVRVTGTAVGKADGDPAFSAGTLTVRDFQALPVD